MSLLPPVKLDLWLPCELSNTGFFGTGGAGFRARLADDDVEEAKLDALEGSGGTKLLAPPLMTPLPEGIRWSEVAEV